MNADENYVYFILQQYTFLVLLNQTAQNTKWFLKAPSMQG